MGISYDFTGFSDVPKDQTPIKMFNADNEFESQFIFHVPKEGEMFEPRIDDDEEFSNEHDWVLKGYILREGELPKSEWWTKLLLAIKETYGLDKEYEYLIAKDVATSSWNNMPIVAVGNSVSISETTSRFTIEAYFSFKRAYHILKD